MPLAYASDDGHAASGRVSRCRGSARIKQTKEPLTAAGGAVGGAKPERPDDYRCPPFHARHRQAADSQPLGFDRVSAIAGFPVDGHY
ncbi:hypothetical protein C3F00_034235, partial [Pseudomonas sp. MWU13-2860]